VAQRIADYREPGGTPFDAWDRAREDYRQINTTGGDPVLRDAEHYLLRYWLGSMGTKFGRIPNGLPIKGSPNPTIWLNSTVVENFHDPAYNALRPVIEKVLNIAPTTPEMKGWEQRGFREGYCASGDCGTGKRVQELLFGTDPSQVGPPDGW
jgi:hypothetical protein